MKGNILRLLHKEETKLSQQVATIGQQLTKVRGAITALNGNDRVQHHTTRLEPITTKPRRKMSAAHRKAIRDGIARAKAAKK